MKTLYIISILVFNLLIIANCSKESVAVTETGNPAKISIVVTIGADTNQVVRKVEREDVDSVVITDITIPKFLS